jgi:hypothetical protein
VSVLRSLEAKIEGLVQGTFSRVFKSRVQPVEIARKLAKEMDDHKTVSISRVYVPNHYAVFLSPGDREQFSDYESGLKRELSDYLLEHARAEGLALATRPGVEFKTDERLRLGEFGIQPRTVDAPREDGGQPEQGDFGHTMVYSPDRPSRPLPSVAPAPRALVTIDGKRRELHGERMTIGRSHDCDLVLDDPNVSRRHAELSREGDGWAVADLGSTNGITVNGSRVRRAVLAPGDAVELGRSRLTYAVE